MPRIVSPMMTRLKGKKGFSPSFVTKRMKREKKKGFHCRNEIAEGDDDGDDDDDPSKI